MAMDKTTEEFFRKAAIEKAKKIVAQQPTQATPTAPKPTQISEAHDTNDVKCP